MAKYDHPGQPLKFQSVEELQKLIDKYFDETPFTQWMITGLAVALDTSRQTLINYESKDGYFDAIKRAKLKIEYAYEARLAKRGGAGDIFALKNFGWKDKQDVDVTTNGENINATPDPALAAEFSEWLKNKK